MALFSADDITYPPLDVPKPVADGVWIVDSGPLRVFGLLGLPIRMTALQLSSGDMLLHSPTRFDVSASRPRSRRMGLSAISSRRTSRIGASWPNGSDSARTP